MYFSNGFLLFLLKNFHCYHLTHHQVPSPLLLIYPKIWVHKLTVLFWNFTGTSLVFFSLSYSYIVFSVWFSAQMTNSSNLLSVSNLCCMSLKTLNPENWLTIVKKYWQPPTDLVWKGPTKSRWIASRIRLAGANFPFEWKFNTLTHLARIATSVLKRRNKSFQVGETRMTKSHVPIHVFSGSRIQVRHVLHYEFWGKF